MRAMLYIEGKPSLFEGFVEARNSVPIHGHLGQTEPMVQPAPIGLTTLIAGFSLGTAKRAGKRCGAAVSLRGISKAKGRTLVCI